MSAVLTESIEPFEQWMAAWLAHFEQYANDRLPAAQQTPQRLHQAMRYAVLGSGKRVRPLLVYAAGQALNAPESALDAAALAVECVHAYSLIHDDLPCMDNDALRRGKATVHIAYDEATALLAGDALQAEAFKALAVCTLPPQQVVAMMGTLAQAASTTGMCGGQAMDLAAVGQRLTLDALERMHRMKTGALLVASVRLGAIAGGANEYTLHCLDQYAQALGLAFQVIDDILDVEGTSDALGKTAGKDAQQNKPTYVSVIGLEPAKARALALRTEALEALARLSAHNANEAVCLNHTAYTHLNALADLITARTY